MNYFYFILLFGVCGCLDSEGSKSYWKPIYDGKDYDNHQEDPIEKPCASLDLNCIRYYLAQNSNCLPAYGPAPDPFKLEKLPLEIPHANMTFVPTDVKMTGFNKFKIGNFYINKKTDTLVLELILLDLDATSPEVVVTYHRQGKEPIILKDFARINFRDVSLTLTVPIYSGQIQISGARVYSYISDQKPKFAFGPNFTESTDPTVIEANREMMENIGLTLQETFLVQGPIYSSVLLQSSLCNFWHTTYEIKSIIKVSTIGWTTIVIVMEHGKDFFL